MQYRELNALLGHIDLHLLDQILKGRYEPTQRVLDAGCGEGRNLPYFVRNGFDVWGVDDNPMALRLLRLQGRAWSATFDPEKFIESHLDKLPFPPARFDAVICCAVLHFARDEDHFFRMVDELLRVLKPSGSLFIRMNTFINGQVDPLLDEEPRFLLTPNILEQLFNRYPLGWLEPERTEHITDQAAQSTLMLTKLA